MKKILLIISTLLLSLFLVACTNNKTTNFTLSGDVAEFNETQFETYVDHRRNKDYDGSMMIESDDLNIANFYIWGNDLRKELRLQFSFIIEELFKIHETKVYTFEVELDDYLTITFNTRLLVKLEKTRATTLIALMLPKTFYSTRENLRVGLILTSYSLEVIDDLTVTQIKTTSTSNLEYQYNQSNITSNTFYSFETNEEILSIINNTYVPRTINLNTEEVRAVSLNELTIGKIYDGRYHWYEFYSSEDQTLVFIALAGFGFTIEIYDTINSNIIASTKFDDGNDRLELDVSQFEYYYIKIYYKEIAKTDYFGFAIDTNIFY